MSETNWAVRGRVEEWDRLEVWKVAHGCALEIFRLKQSWPAAERFGLTDQVFRSALSVSTNIAEGKGRATVRDFRNFLIIARGSVEETRNLLRFARDVGLITLSEFQSLDDRYLQVRRMLNGFVAHLNSKL